MTFVPKTWKDRLVEYAGRRKLKNVSTGEEVLMDVSRSEGTVSQAGDAFNATNMNDLEQRIKTEFDNVNSSFETQPNFIYDSTGKITGYKTKVGADTVFPFSGGYKNAKQVHVAGDNAYHSVKLSSDTYGTDFMVIFTIYTYSNSYSYSFPTSGDLSCSLLIDNALFYPGYVTSRMFVLKADGEGALTINYQSTDVNIHGGRIVVLY